MTTPLTPERIAWLLEHGAFHDEDAADLAQIYNASQTRAARCRHWLLEYARAKNEGYTVGDLSVFNQRSVFRQVPNPEHVAAYIDSMEPHERQHEIRRLLEKIRVDWMMADLRKQDYWPFLQKQLDADPDGYIEVKGEPSLDVRAKPPAEAYTEIVPPLGEPEPETPQSTMPEGDVTENADGLSPGD